MYQDVQPFNLANNTGTHSVYTKWQGYEIMFHVATLLPFKASDNQQLEKKRHIGNDLVIIIFHEGKQPFDMASIPSQQNHMAVIVTPEPNGYRHDTLTKIAISDKRGGTRIYTCHSTSNHNLIRSRI
jgi:RAP1 GTPase activating protein 1